MIMLAAIPSRFQPIHFLKPRPSAVNSPRIHPPAGAHVEAHRNHCSGG
jgi:hypothetical protein